MTSDTPEYEDFYVNKEEISIEEVLANFENVVEAMNYIPKKYDRNIVSTSLYQISSNDEHRLFRRSDSASDALNQYWLSKVRNIASFSRTINEIPTYKGIDRDYLEYIASLSTDDSNLSSIERVLFDAGILLVTENSMPGSKVDGVTFLLDESIPVIGLSLRYSRYDYFWFTLLHELSHVFLHIETAESAIIDDFEDPEDNEREEEANLLAANSLIPRHVWRSLRHNQIANDTILAEHAEPLNVHPAILAGRIRKETGNYSRFNSIINSINVREFFF